MIALKLVKRSRRCIALMDTSEIEFYGRHDADIYCSFRTTNKRKKKYSIKFSFI